jgi:hypothetical protein
VSYSGRADSSRSLQHGIANYGVSLLQHRFAVLTAFLLEVILR